jgi:alpha-tubulin suppressor-like RCC1 family protein
MASLSLGLAVAWSMYPTTASATSAGTVVAWGDNAYGQTTGVPSLVEPFYASAIPVTLGGQTLSGVTAIAAGGGHSVAVKSGGTVVAWGWNGWGQTDVPAGLNAVTAVAAASYHTVALKSDGTVVAWGAGATGTGCFPDCGQTMVPGGLSGVTAIAAGSVHTLALKSDGSVVAWGANGYDLGQTNIPAGLTSVTAIVAGSYHNLALKIDGTVVAWGWNGFGQTDVPVGLSGVTAIATGFRFSVALKNDGSVVVWGGEGQADIPAGVSSVTAIAANAYDIQALKSDGTVVAWGANAYGAAIVPAGLSGVTAIAGGGFHTVALVAPSVNYSFTGFSSPVDSLPTLNIVSAGSAIPVKFSLGGDQGLSIFAAGYPVSGPLACDAIEPDSVIEETVNAAGSSLTYDIATDQYNYVWKTNKAWKGTCRMFVVRLIDGTDHLAKFRFR